jgi:hypothetical protein
LAANPGEWKAALFAIACVLVMGWIIMAITKRL